MLPIVGGVTNGVGSSHIVGGCGYRTNEIRHVKLLYNFTRHQRRVVFSRIAWVDQELPVNLSVGANDIPCADRVDGCRYLDLQLQGSTQTKRALSSKWHSQIVNRPLHTAQDLQINDTVIEFIKHREQNSPKREHSKEYSSSFHD